MEESYDRFKGFADLYDEGRPKLPNKSFEILKRYLKFDFCREICFDVEMEYDKERFKKFILSKSNIQKAIRNNYKHVIDKLENLDNYLDDAFEGKTLKALFSYKMKIGIK